MSRRGTQAARPTSETPSNINPLFALFIRFSLTGFCLPLSLVSSPLKKRAVPSFPTDLTKFSDREDKGSDLVTFPRAGTLLSAG